MQKNETCQKCEGDTRQGRALAVLGRDGSGQKRLAKTIGKSYRTRRRVQWNCAKLGSVQMKH